MHTGNILVEVIDKELKKKKELMLPTKGEMSDEKEAEHEVFQQEEAGRMKDPKIVAIEKVAKGEVTDKDYKRIAGKDWVVEEEPLEPDEENDKEDDVTEEDEPSKLEKEDKILKKIKK